MFRTSWPRDLELAARAALAGHRYRDLPFAQGGAARALLTRLARSRSARLASRYPTGVR